MAKWDGTDAITRRSPGRSCFNGGCMFCFWACCCCIAPTYYLHSQIGQVGCAHPLPAFPCTSTQHRAFYTVAFGRRQVKWKKKNTFAARCCLSMAVLEPPRTGSPACTVRVSAVPFGHRFAQNPPSTCLLHTTSSPPPPPAESVGCLLLRLSVALMVIYILVVAWIDGYYPSLPTVQFKNHQLP